MRKRMERVVEEKRKVEEKYRKVKEYVIRQEKESEGKYIQLIKEIQYLKDIVQKKYINKNIIEQPMYLKKESNRSRERSRNYEI